MQNRSTLASLSDVAAKQAPILLANIIAPAPVWGDLAPGV